MEKFNLWNVQTVEEKLELIILRSFTKIVVSFAKAPRPNFDCFLGSPYGGSISQFNTVEANMKRRRAEVQALLGPDERIFSMSCCPRLGCPEFSFPEFQPGVSFSKFAALCPWHVILQASLIFVGKVPCKCVMRKNFFPE